MSGMVLLLCTSLIDIEASTEMGVSRCSEAGLASCEKKKVAMFKEGKRKGV